IGVAIVVFPILHEHADDLVALALEQPGGNRRVDASGQAENDAVFGVHGGTASVLERRDSGQSPGGCRGEPVRSAGRAAGRRHAKAKGQSQRPCPSEWLAALADQEPGPAAFSVSFSAFCLCCGFWISFGVPFWALSAFCSAGVVGGLLVACACCPCRSICRCAAMPFLYMAFSSGDMDA